jgi:SAM-dependent methyltransferase
MSGKTKTTIDYGNWVAKKRVIVLWICFAAGALLTVAGFVLPPASWPMPALLGVRVVPALFTLFCLVMGAFMTKARQLFSYSGGRVSAQILDELVARIRWDGAGKALDIGCGSGALTIRVAKKFKDAHVTGIDYWGAGWEYAQEQCEQNAESEGVAERAVFQKGDAAKLDFANEAFDLAVSNFVFHEVKSQPQKRLVIKEALRVVKKGSPFVFHDLFYAKGIYGDSDDLLRELKSRGLTEVQLERTSDRSYIPGVLRAPMFLKDIGVIYGVR